MDFLPLSILFFLTGILAALYYAFIPSKGRIHTQLPNRVSVTSVLLTLLIGGLVWYIFATFEGSARFRHLMELLFGLLLFESFFLFLMHWIRSNALNVTLSLLTTGAVFATYFASPSFFLINTILILATLGAATLLIRMGYLRTRILFIIAILWTIYDVMLVNFILPRVFVPVTDPIPTFLYPAVTVGELTLGSGDFMFLSLFTLIILRDYGRTAALFLIVSETAGLLMTGLLLPESGFLLPFLLVMTPIFFLVYGVAWWQRRRIISRSSPWP